MGTKFVVSSSNSTDSHEDSIIVQIDTMISVHDGEFVHNLPCKVHNINQSKKGKVTTQVYFLLTRIGYAELSVLPNSTKLEPFGSWKLLKRMAIL